MKLTREEALKYHRQMWGDMQKELGDNPSAIKRLQFKDAWCYEHFPDEYILNSCFLCEYANNDCAVGCCLIDWPYGCCTNHSYYCTAPISEILALPERKRKEDKA